MKNFKSYKNRYAQQLVEFLLVAPFIIIILGIVTEYAYALNVNMTLANGLKTITSEIYQSIKPNMNATEIRDTVQDDLTVYLRDKNTISSDSSGDGLTVSVVESGNNTVFIAEFKYSPAFTLPNVYFKFMPNTFDFIATSVVPTSFLRGNNYGSSIDTADLDTTWANPVGVLNSASGRNNMIFLVPANPIIAPGLGKPYRTHLWGGNFLAPIIDATDGGIYLCSPMPVGCSPTGQNVATAYPAITNIIFVHDADPIWASVLNRALSLVDIDGKSIGNYDNIAVSTYNPTVAPLANQYTVTVLNNRVFVHTAADTGNAIIP